MDRYLGLGEVGQGARVLGKTSALLPSWKIRNDYFFLEAPPS